MVTAWFMLFQISLQKILKPIVWKFEEIQNIAGILIDHFFEIQKRMIDYDYYVGKISMKNQTVLIVDACKWYVSVCVFCVYLYAFL